MSRKNSGIYEKADGDSRNNVVTTAVWKDEEAFQNAKKSAAEGFKKIAFNPSEIMKALKVEIERAVYRRSPFLPALAPNANGQFEKHALEQGMRPSGNTSSITGLIFPEPTGVASSPL